MPTSAVTSPASPNLKRLFGLFCAICAAIGFSGKAILIKLAYPEGIDAVSLLALRMLFSVPVFLYAALRESRQASRLSGKDWALIVMLGLIGYYLSSLFDFMGLQYISASLERLILFLYPTFVVLLSALFFRKPLRAYQIGAILLCYLGLGVVYADEHLSGNANVMLGAGLVFLSAMTYACYLIGAGQMVHKIGATRFTAYAMLVACIATLTQYAVSNDIGALFGYSHKVYVLSLLMAIFATVLPVFMLAFAIKQIGAGNAAMIGSLGPVATIVMAVYFLHEPLTASQVIGSILVLLGVSWVGAKSRRNA